jgi:PAS domain S-box-containing protein
MAMEFFQYQVDKKWYRLYWGVMLGFDVVFLTLLALSHLLPSLHEYTSLFAVNDTMLILAGIHFLYLVGGFWIMARYSWPFAALVGTMFFSLSLLNGLTMTDPGKGSLLYIAAWFGTIFMAGVYGLPPLAGFVFLIYVYVSMQSGFQLLDVSPSSWFLLGGTALLAILSYFFWRNRYVSIEAQKVNQLSGMLRSNQQQAEVLIESIADGIIVTNTDGKITLMNPAAAKMTEWKVEEALGVDAPLVVKLTHESGAELEEGENPFAEVLSKKQQVTQVFQLVGQEGKTIVISLAISPVILSADAKPIGAIAVMRDISNERAAEKQRGEFISTASHEMRTPVAAIEGYLALALNDKVSTVDSRARGYLEKAHSSTQHLGKLFQDLLTSSKAEDGRLSNHPSVVEMGAFMQQLTDDLKFAAEKKGLLAEFVIGGAKETIDATTKDASTQHLLKPFYYVHVDPERMREVITNLFDNACKYTDSGKISIGLTGNTEVVQLYVRDTGAGIPPDDIPHLFQKFYRVDNSATRTIGGTGLGLFICRKIVELYHGRIWVESAVGKGSTFFINLPRLSTQRAGELQSSEANKPSTPTAATSTPGKS